jgi:hypothetical protein
MYPPQYFFFLCHVPFSPTFSPSFSGGGVF